MSSLLEQAIIDAAALKEAAIKNAETAILNKYSADIKEVVENLFEAIDDDGENADEENAKEATESPPLQHTLSPALDPAQNNDSEIILSLEELKDMAEVLSAAEEDLMGGPSSHEDLAAEVTPGTPPSLSPEHEVATSAIDVTLEEEIDVVDLDDLIEELMVDIAPQKSGWAGTPAPIMNYKEQLRLAQLSATEAKEENAELVAARERLSEHNNKLKTTVRLLKERFDDAILSNAKLLYTNRVLTNGSLNERQKARIVEALSKADSINDAKVIFETLESAVGSVRGKTQSKSLRETLERPTATLPRREARRAPSPQTDRMQILAGIKKSKD